LKYCDIKHSELSLFESYLINRKKFVDIDGTTSDMLSLTTGVPQGSVLGPLLFIIYMNDISFANKIFKPIIYADDSTLTSILQAFNINCNNNNNNSDQINSELDQISDWLKINKLSLNESKSKCMVFHSYQKQVVSLKLQINRIVIKHIKEFNFLVVVKISI
jgi:hypothetical protein